MYEDKTIYKTNAALGYNQYAYLIPIDREQMLCIDFCGDYAEQDSYVIGSVYSFDRDERFYLEIATNYELIHSPLYGSFLFSYFLDKNFTDKVEIND
jgi:hypothetical protein